MLLYRRRRTNLAGRNTLPDEMSERGGGADPEFAFQKLAEPSEVEDRLATVALGEECSGQCHMCTLTQRFRSHRGQAQLDR